MPLEEFISKFARLNTDRGRHRWLADTCHRAPHKPFLILSIMDLIAQGLITENFIEPSFELVDTWNGYWDEIVPDKSKSSMAYPFFYIKSDGFWKLIDNPAYSGSPGRSIKSINTLRVMYLGAAFDLELFQFMQAQESRDKLCSVLISTYFSVEMRPKVIKRSLLNKASYEYSQTLLDNNVSEQMAPFEDGDDSIEKKKVRSAGFRKAILSLYVQRCSLCGIRMITPDDHTVVVAAHIIPWSKSYNDHPTNGLCLCPLCHWSFDKGLMSVDKQYKVMVSERVRSDKNNPGHILTLAERNILRPDEEQYWPDQENLSWHRKNTYI